MTDDTKYKPAELPESAEEAHELANRYEAMASDAREGDRHGTGRMFELLTLLLREFARHKEGSS